jgi:hypothetical protein
MKYSIVWQTYYFHLGKQFISIAMFLSPLSQDDHCDVVVARGGPSESAADIGDGEA